MKKLVALRRLVYAGIDKDTEYSIAKTIIVTNFLALLCALLCAFYTPILLFFGATSLGIELGIVSILFAQCLVLNYRRHLLLSRILLAVCFNVALTYYCLKLGQQSYVRFLYLPVAVVPNFIFVRKERKVAAFLVVSAIALHFWFEAFGGEGSRSRFVSEELQNVVHYISLFSIYVLLISPVVYLRLITEKNEVDLLKAIRERDAAKSLFLEAQAKIVSSAKLSTLGEMASGIAHEINNPLSIIEVRARQITSLLQQENIQMEKVIHYSEIISATVFRIARIIKGLRTFARDAEGTPFEPARVESVVDDTLAFCSERFTHNAIQLHVSEIPKSLTIECRPTEVSQILLNLLSNAFDAVFDLPEPRWVSLVVIESVEWVEVRITDCGRGIPVEIREKILHPFFSTKEVGKGTGLGLSIASGIAKAHKGELWYDESTRHTTFVLKLPKRQTKERHIDESVVA